MSEVKHTPGPWIVRTFVMHGAAVDCFVAAKDVQGFAYDAVIMGDDEYRDGPDGIRRKLADARLIAAAPELLEALQEAAHYLAFTEQADAPHMQRIKAAISKATSLPA